MLNRSHLFQNRGRRIVAMLILLAILASAMSLTAFAASVSFSGTVGEAEEFWFHVDYETDVNDYDIANGYLPGMYLDQPNPSSVRLVGTPTQAGTYTLYIWVLNSNGEQLEYTVTVVIKEAEKPTEATKPADGIPKITKNPTDEEVVETDSATFIARADNTRQYVWELITVDGGVIPCKDLPGTFKNMTVHGASTDTLTLNNIPLALDGCHVRCRFVGSDETVYSKEASILVTSLDDVKPEITKHPTGETITEGEDAVFVAKAKYAKQIIWVLTSPDGKTSYECKDAAKYFPGLKVSGTNKESLVLEHIPLEMNGWLVQCKFVGGAGTVVTDAAVITVEAEPTEPTEAPTEEPTEAPTEAPTEEPTEAPTEAATEAPTEQTQAATEAPTEAPEQKEEKSGGSNVLLIVLVAVASLGIGAGGAVVLVGLKNKGGRD